MALKPIAIAVVVLLAVLSIPLILSFLSPSVPAKLSQGEVEKIASNYIAANYPGSTVTSMKVTAVENDQYKITIEYNQQTGNTCTRYKCYWEGPASQYCRQDSPAGLGKC